MAEKKSKLAENKIKPTTDSVEDFIAQVTPEQKREDSYVLLNMMKRISGLEPVLWSNGYIGFGMRRHKSETSGREADWMRLGFAPRKANFSVYFGSYIDNHTDALQQLGKHKTGLGCLYINKLADVRLDVLEQMIEEGSKLP
jgi:hypothetical protein